MCWDPLSKASRFGLESLVERQNGKRGLESGFGSAGYANGI